MQFNTCRLCNGRPEWRHGFESTIVKYGVRHWAHLQCLKDRLRLQRWLEQTPTWILNHLPYFELEHLGILGYVQDRVKRETEVA